MRRLSRTPDDLINVIMLKKIESDVMHTMTVLRHSHLQLAVPSVCAQGKHAIGFRLSVAKCLQARSHQILPFIHFHRSGL